MSHSRCAEPGLGSAHPVDRQSVPAAEKLIARGTRSEVDVHVVPANEVQYDNRDSLNQRQKESALKLRLKRIGGDEAKLQDRELIQRVEAQLADLDLANKEQKKKITALHKGKNRFLGKYFA
jgi:hypothetical protein